MKDRETPLRLVRKWEKMIPGVYNQLDILRAAKEDGEILWPDYCELPIGAAFTLLVEKEGLSIEQSATVAAELTACWTWRRNKKIYWFDADLAAVLAEQAEDMEGTDVLPCELLMHLPYSCVYIKAPGLLEYTDGFWAWIEYDLNTKKAELRVQWVTEDMEQSFAQVMHLLPGETLKTCILDTVHTIQENLHEDIQLKDVDISETRIILTAIQLLLYLLSENAQIESRPSEMKKGKAIRNVVTLECDADKAGQVEAFDVGIRIGAALRRAKRYMPYEDNEPDSTHGTGKSKRTHARRGHWHHYWTGPKKGERKLILKWTAPTIINADKGKDDNIVIFPVVQEKNPKKQQ